MTVEFYFFLNLDMFEDEESNNFSTKNVCSFCHKTIKMFPAQSIDSKYKFCDLICAKLFFDNNEHFTLDIKRYNNYYNEHEISKKATDIYERCRYLLFEQLPIYQPLQNDLAFNNPELMKKIYNKVLNPVLFKHIGACE